MHAPKYNRSYILRTEVLRRLNQASRLSPQAQFGHGKKTLLSVLVVLNLLAFALHGAGGLIEIAWRVARAGTRIGLFQALRVLTIYQLFPSWDDLFTLLTTDPPQRLP